MAEEDTEPVISRIDNIGVAVRDVEAVASFFERNLGMTVERYEEAQPSSAVVRIGQQYLYLFQTTDTAAPARRNPELSANPPGVDHISFTVSDVDASYALLCERGVQFDDPPATAEEWGIRMAAFRDPEGNIYYLVQPL